MNRIQPEHLTELTLIVTLPHFVDKNIKPKSRTFSLFQRITKYSVKTLELFPPIGRIEYLYSFNRLEKFFTKMKWREDVKLDVVMMLSFLLGLIDGSSFRYPQSIIDALNDTFEWIAKEDSEDITGYIAEAEKALAVWRAGMPKIKEAA